MGLLQFIFSSFWAWLGFTILAAGAASSIIEVAKTASKKGHRITVNQFENGWCVTIDNATDMDVMSVLKAKEQRSDGQAGDAARGIET